MKKINKIQILRFAVLTFLLFAITGIAYLHQKKGGGPDGVPSIHTVCPFGGLETIYKVIAGGEFLKRTNTSNFILLGLTVLLTILFGRFFCGFLCVVGWMQELFGKLGNLIFKKRFNIPLLIDKPLRYLKYIILALVLFFTWRLGNLIISPFDPFAAYAHFSAGFNELFGEFLIGTLILILMLLLSLFYDRVFCKYLCPMGAFLGILNKISLFKITRDRSTCISCNKCSKVCPVNIDVAKIDKVTSVECINCMECITICPTKKDTLKTKVVWKNINPFVIVLIGVLTYFGTIAFTNVTGIWKDKPSTLISLVKKDGKSDPYGIRGFMTIKDISQLFKIDIDSIYKELNLDKNTVPDSTRIKELSKFSSSVTEEYVRDKVAEMINYKKE